MKKLYFLIFLSVIGTSLKAQVMSWAKQFTGNDISSNSITRDASGNTYTTGFFFGTVDFDPGPGTFNLAGLNEVYICKLDAAGNFVWVKHFGGAGDEYHLVGITLDASGNIYTSGTFGSIAGNTVDFDPGPGVFNLTTTWFSTFISKLDAAGNFVWAKQFGAGAIGKSIALDASGNIYTSGNFGNTVDFDPGPATYNLIASGPGDIFVSKLDAAGNFTWAKKMGGTGYDGGNSMAVDASGNVYTTGTFEGTADFDPGAATFNLTAAGAAGTVDIFVSKLDATGNFVWAKRMGGTDYDYGSSIILDASGNVYTTGEFLGTADFDPGAAAFNLISAGDYDAFVSKLDAAGNFVWAKRFGGVDPDGGASIALDVSGNVYATGRFYNVADFDPGAATFNLTSAGQSDIFISKLDAGGNFVWAIQLGGTDYDEGVSIALDASNNVLTTGSFYSTADFDPCPGVFNLTTTASFGNPFVHKLSQAVTSPIVTSDATVCSGNNSGTLTLSAYSGVIFRWESSTDNFATTTPIANTTATQNYSNLTVTTKYRAVVQNGSCAPFNSAAATITVTNGTVAGVVATDATVCSGSNSGTLTLSGHTGTILRWESSTDNFVTATTIANTTTTQNYSNLTVTTKYRAVVQNGTCTPANSAPATITVTNGTVAGAVATDATVCSGSNSGTLTLSGHTGAILRWESSTDNFVTATTIANTTTTQNYSNLTVTTKYRAVVQNGTCTPANSSPATITVTNGTVAGAVATDATVCSGSNSGTLTLSGHTGTILRWESSTDNFVTTTTIANATTTHNYLNLTQTTKYRAVVQNGTCTPANSSPATITVTNGTVAGAVGADATACSGGNSGTLTLSGHTGTILRWESSTDNFVTTATIANATTTQNYSNLTQTTKYRAVVQNGSCTPANSAPATITVTNGTVAGAVGADATACSGGNSGTLTLSGHTGTILRWESSTDNFVTTTTIANATTTQNYLNLTQTTKYRAVVQNGTCTVANSVPATITITMGGAQGQFDVAPNPNYGQFWIRYYNQVTEQMTLTVYDLSGAKVHQQKVSSSLPCLGTRVDIDLGHVQLAGMYLVELRGADGHKLAAKRILIFRH